MFRLRRGGHHDHDSDAECCNDNNHHQQQHPTGEVTSSISVTTAATTTGTAMIRRKRVRRSNGVSKNYVFQQWMKKMRRPETSAIFVLGIAGCVIAGCILFIVLKLFTAMTTTTSSSSSNNHHYTNNAQNHHGRKNFQGWGGAVYKGPRQLHHHDGNGNTGRRGLQQQHGRDDAAAAASTPSSRKNDGGNGGGQGDGDDSYEILPWNPIYRIPDAYETVGDRSDAYAKLRKEMDAILPIDPERSLSRLQELQRRDANGILLGSQPHEIIINTENDEDEEQHEENELSSSVYDIFNCPDEPPRNYPHEWKLVDEVLHDWPANEINIPQRVHQGLCVFDYIQDYEKAMRYRHAELPFVVTGDPDVARTVERWAIPGYVEELMGDNVRHRAEYNTNNHFLYHQPPPRPRRGQRGGGVGQGQRGGRGRRGAARGDPSRDEPEGLQDLYGRPAKLQRSGVMPDELRMTYKEWLSKANGTSTTTTTTSTNGNGGAEGVDVGPNDEHWYFRLIGCGYMGADGSCDAGSSEYLFDELPFFQPVDNLYLAQGDKQKGIHCRFGMKGVIAENHFDASRNSIVVLRGTRRYILSHPNNCDKLTLLPQGHPSARHSAVDYTNPDLETFPEFAEAMANEVVLQAGQVLYLPTSWFHFIVSLDLNMQCNTRSGVTSHYQEPIEQCGF